jgi:hypothetical protein
MPEAPGPEDAPAAAYVVAFVVYVALGFFLKSVVLNWIVGPTFLLLVLYVVPKAFGRVR